MSRIDRLRHGARKPVEHEARLRIRARQPLAHDALHYLVAHEPAGIHHGLCRAAQRRVRRHRFTQDVAGRNLRHAVLLREPLGLRALTRPGGAEHHQVERHGRVTRQTRDRRSGHARRPRIRVFFMKPS